MVAKLAPSTVRTNLGVLNAAVDAELIARSLGRGIRTAGGQSRERPTLALEELSRLAEAVLTSTGCSSSSPAYSACGGRRRSG
jgi:hypothetical protein